MYDHAQGKMADNVLGGWVCESMILEDKYKLEEHHPSVLGMLEVGILWKEG